MTERLLVATETGDPGGCEGIGGIYVGGGQKRHKIQARRGERGGLRRYRRLSTGVSAGPCIFEIVRDAPMNLFRG